MSKNINFENSWGEQVEILPRFTIVYGLIISLEWLWWGIWIDIEKDSIEPIEVEYDMPLYPDSDAPITWTKYKIIVPTEEDKRVLEQAFEHIHYADVNTDYVPVNQLIHEYSDPTNNNIVVDETTYTEMLTGELTEDDMNNVASFNTLVRNITDSDVGYRRKIVLFQKVIDEIKKIDNKKE